MLGSWLGKKFMVHRMFLCSCETVLEQTIEIQQIKASHTFDLSSHQLITRKRTDPGDYIVLNFSTADFRELIQSRIKCFSTCKITDKINTAL